eukprot:1740794-Prymnesium_polylepis.1
MPQALERKERSGHDVIRSSTRKPSVRMPTPEWWKLPEDWAAETPIFFPRRTVFSQQKGCENPVTFFFGPRFTACSRPLSHVPSVFRNVFTAKRV